jgi:FtsP/CotA-like multicopper oxidase with cupredoxin domain
MQDVSWSNHQADENKLAEEVRTRLHASHREAGLGPLMCEVCSVLTRACASQRQMTRLIRALVVTLVVTRGAFANDDVAPPVHGLALTAPPVLVGRHGQLHVDLTAAPGEYTNGGERFEGMLYNNAYIPPVWRLKPGDMLTVALHNRLQQPTNLHFHGLHVAPHGHGDNVFVQVGPGESFQYRIHIPHDHDSGLYWFHTHATAS